LIIIPQLVRLSILLPMLLPIELGMTEWVGA
jgi:hypothetical protein